MKTHHSFQSLLYLLSLLLHAPTTCQSQTNSTNSTNTTSIVDNSPPRPTLPPTMRGGTYCEIIHAGPADPANNLLPTTAYVSWNGTGGSCPANPGFFNVTVDDVRAVHGREADIVLFNGMRQWMVDVISSQKTTEPETKPENSTNPENTTSSEEQNNKFFSYGSMFPDGSGLLMYRAATVTFSSSGKPAPYTPNHVDRHSTFIWEANSTVYELVHENCKHIYVMQSLFLGRPQDPGVVEGEDDLETLEAEGKIEPPQGWLYRWRVLEEDLVIVGVNGTNVVLGDDAGNSYSAMDDGFDAEALCPKLVTGEKNETVVIGGEEGEEEVSTTRSATSVGFKTSHGVAWVTIGYFLTSAVQWLGYALE